jgi:hypothetical protein
VQLLLQSGAGIEIAYLEMASKVGENVRKYKQIREG